MNTHNATLKVLVLSIALLGINNVFSAEPEKQQSSILNKKLMNKNNNVVVFKVMIPEKQQHKEKIAAELKRVIEKNSNGEIVLEIITGGNNEIDPIKLNVSQISFPNIDNINKINASYDYLNLPFLAKNESISNKLISGNAAKFAESETQKSHIKVLGYINGGFNGLYSKEKISDFSNLKDKKILIKETPTKSSQFKAFKMVPIGDQKEEYTLGEANVLDYTYSNLNKKGFPYYYATNHTYSYYAIAMNNNFYNTLTDNAKEILNKSINEITPFSQKTVHGIIQNTVQNIGNDGVKYFSSETLTDNLIGKISTTKKTDGTEVINKSGMIGSIEPVFKEFVEKNPDTIQRVRESLTN